MLREERSYGGTNGSLPVGGQGAKNGKFPGAQIRVKRIGALSSSSPSANLVGRPNACFGPSGRLLRCCAKQRSPVKTFLARRYICSCASMRLHTKGAGLKGGMFTRGSG